MDKVILSGFFVDGAVTAVVIMISHIITHNSKNRYAFFWPSKTRLNYSDTACL